LPALHYTGHSHDKQHIMVYKVVLGCQQCKPLPYSKFGILSSGTQDVNVGMF